MLYTQFLISVHTPIRVIGLEIPGIGPSLSALYWLFKLNMGDEGNMFWLR